jgi:stage V sporulation protein R
MRDNSLLLQILTIAHVYGHNDFFRNNFTFRTTRAEHTISRVKAQGNRVRSYIEDPSIGIDKVEAVLDAAHAVSLQCRRNLAVHKRSPEEARQVLIERAKPPEDPFRNIHRRVEYQEPDLHRVPLEPDEDLLLFIRDHNPHLAEWEKDLLTIAHESAQYFIPQIETKIMNEGWATYWHKRILDSLELPHDLQIEFIVRHSQVVRPMSGNLNPYHLGLRIWEDIRRRCDEPEPGEEISGRKNGKEMLFEVRAVDRDASFLRRFLTERLIRELNLFEYRAQGENLVVTEVADREGWRQIKETLINSVGMGSVPVIRIVDSDYGQNRTLYLVHEHDGRDLQLEYAEKTLAFVNRLWHRDVALETIVEGSRTLLRYGEQGFTTKAIK